MSAPLRCWEATHPGTVRSQNQDACLCRPAIGLFAVADGVGGHGDGVAASRAVMEILAAVPDDLAPSPRLAAIRAALQDAHARLLDAGAASEPEQTLATTVVVLMLHEDHFACLWAGDSRLYLLRQGVLRCLTSDHSVVQDLLDAGALSEDEAERDPRRHIITRAIGAGERNLLVEKVVGRIIAEDRFLLCSDGLYEAIGTEALGALLASRGDVAAELVEAALRLHARDNVTAVIAAP